MSRFVEKYFYIQDHEERTIGDFLFVVIGSLYVIGLLAFVITKTM